MAQGEKKTTRARLAEFLQVRKRREDYLALLSCLALVVCVATIITVMQRASALNHTETVLDCHYEGDAAHVHTTDCYDKSGTLVCPLAEREPHVHTDSCYTETRTLVCGKSEGEQADGTTHTHDDSCYEITRELTCGKDELTEEHVHGPGCFKTVKGPDAVGAEEATTSTGDDEHLVEATITEGTMVFTDKLLDDDGTVLVKVYVEAPEGAFPEGTTMKVTPVNSEQVEGAISDAVAERTEGKITQMQTIDITFYDADGAEVEPAKPITVTLTSDLIAENEDPMVVHVDNNGKADVVNPLDSDELDKRKQEVRKDEVVFDADHFSPYSIVMVDEGTKGKSATPRVASSRADRVQFDSNEFSTYSIIVTTLRQKLTASDGNTYSITVDCPPAAGVPKGSKLEVSEVANASRAYYSYLDKVSDELSSSEDVSYARFFDLSIVSNGQKVQPAAPVSVKIKLADAEASEADTQLRVAHFSDDASEIEELDAKVTENDDQSVVSFDADNFSIYAIVVTTIEEKVLASDGKTYKATVTFGPDANIPDGTRLKVTEILQGTDDYDAYVDQTARALSNEADGPAIVSDARFFDITLTYRGNKVEPAAPVQVRVELDDAMSVEENGSVEVVHFADEGAEVLDSSQEQQDGAVTAFEFDAASFSTFAFAQANYIGSLNGQKFAIVRDSGANKAAVIANAHPKYANRLEGTWVNVLEDGKLTSVTAANSNVENDVEITAWTFEHVRDNIYTIKDEVTGKYLSIDGTKLGLSDEPCQFELELFTRAKGNIDKEHPELYTGKMRLRQASNTSYMLNLKGNQVANGFQGSTSTDLNSTFALYAAEDLNVFDAVQARKISAADIEGGQQLVVYKRVHSEERDKYEIYVLDGDGNLVYAYDEGDVIAYRTNRPTIWYVIEYRDDEGNLTGYYELYNPETHKYVAPQRDSILSDSETGIRLEGKGNNRGTSTIEAWDKSAWAFYGYQVDTENMTIIPGTGSDSTEFSFARYEPATEGFHEVETVDSKAAGITISMYDFSSRNVMNVVGDDTFYPDGAFKQGLLKKRLGADGLPVAASTGTSFSKIYNSGSFRGEANHLFIKSIYDTTGYYEYNSFKNYARYNQNTGDFTVYDEQGTPANGVGGALSSFFRGNYLPYNDIDPSRLAINPKFFDGLTDLTQLEDPRFRGTLYMAEQPINYFLGTVVEANFMQAKDGLDESGNPIIYEFYGDDDLWVYIDGVLVLDIGGIHSAVRGSIDFSTGQVDVSGTTTTIKQCFKDAGVFPDGTDWDDALVDNYFTGDTFNDYSGHSMKMFYQERGAGASTLEVRFNLPVVQHGSFVVEKQLDGMAQQGYANVQFAYRAFLEGPGGQDVPLYPGVILSQDGEPIDPASATEEELADAVTVTYESNGNNVDFMDNLPIGTQTYDHIFYLKPGEAAQFTGIPEGVRYYVQEVDVSGAYYDTVMINEADMGGEGGIPEDDNVTATSSSKTIQERQRVLFRNRCSEKNQRDLRITKRVDNPTDDGATFEFRVRLETPDGSLGYYASGNYYVTKEVDGKEHYFKVVEGALVDQGTEAQVCSKSGPWGTIAGIPDGYTVVIRGLLAGTDFAVEEINNPEGYLQVSKELVDGTYDASTLAGADGQIALGKDAQVVFTNHRYSVISVTKNWQAEGIRVHGPIKVGLFHRTADGLELAEKNDVMVSEPLQTITYPARKASWYFELPSGASLEDYEVRECVVTGRGANRVVTPVDEGGTLVVDGEIPEAGDDAVSNAYSVAYAKGEETTETQGNKTFKVRRDEITNTRKQLVSFVKVDIANIDRTLEGAVFDLYGTTDGQRDAEPLFAGLVSGENGVLHDGETTEFSLPAGVYELVETEAPEGYLCKESPVTVTVTTADVSYEEGSSISADGRGKSIDPETGAYVLKVSNTSGYELPNSGGRGVEGLRMAGAIIVLCSALFLSMRALQARYER